MHLIWKVRIKTEVINYMLFVHSDYEVNNQ